jgi:lipoteichoic acid synthase
MNNLYDNSLIIITADHHVHSTNFGIDITNELPLYIINGNIDNHIAWHGKCNQLDIYTTLLDLLNIETKWYGLGHSLLSPHYENSLNNMKWDISDQIIQSDFFKNY